MIKSMTGFGKGEYSDGKYSVTVEIKSVNHRYADINVKIPRRYSFAEEKIKNQIKSSVSRGKLDVSVLIEALIDGDISVNLNTGIAEKYISNLKALKESYNLEGEITLELISSMPDVIRAVPDVEDEEEVMAVIGKAVEIAVENLDLMRIKEGKKLAEDLHMRGDLIASYVKKTETKVPETVSNYKEKLNDRISELVSNKIEVPEERILLEAAIFADKTNITEELVRLDSHIRQLHDILGADGSNGKKLDFLVQEMNREANTIGSKVSDIEMTGNVIEIKSEVEKIREQVQNVE